MFPSPPHFFHCLTCSEWRPTIIQIFFLILTTYIVVYFKQSTQYNKLHLLVPDEHEEESKFARINPQAGIDGSVDYRHINMHGY